MSFPYSYSILGLVPGLILTVVVAAIVLYTSLTTWYVRFWNCSNNVKLTCIYQGIRDASSRGPRRLRHWSDAVLQQQNLVVLHRGHVRAQQYIHYGISTSNPRM